LYVDGAINVLAEARRSHVPYVIKSEDEMHRFKQEMFAVNLNGIP
jgi:hypothetical protein